jgi:hypothetical protein
MPPLTPEQQLNADVRAIVTERERLTRLASRWSGIVHITDDPTFLGEKRWNCDIDIDRSLLQTPLCVSTIVHEALHSVSAGLNPFDYHFNRGYEEGTVEQCTRLLRDEIRVALGMPGPLEARNAYPEYIAALEILRARTGKDERDFYLELLKSPLMARENTVVQWIRDAESTRSRAAIERETQAARRRLKP